MAKQRFSLRGVAAVTIVAAIAAVAAALAYLASDPGRMQLSEILATIFGVGLTVTVAGALAGLMIYSARSGHDDDAGGRLPPP